MKKQESLARLEATITNDKTKFVINNNTHAYRTTDGTSRRKSHTLVISPDTGILNWKNENGKEFTHQFESPEAAQEWWKTMVIRRAIKIKNDADDLAIYV